MEKPFEKTMNAFPKPPELTSSSSKFKLFLSFIVVFCTGYFLGNAYNFYQLKAFINKLTADQAPVKRVVTNKPQPNYEFYTMLQNETNHRPVNQNKNSNNLRHKSLASNKRQEVNKNNPGKSTKNNTSKVATNKKNSYLIQAASFKYREEAQRMKASLILKGFPANIIVISRDNTNWYRVMIGPYPSKEQALKTNIAIAKSEHVSGMVRKMDA